MTHLADFVALLEYNVPNSTFKAQKTLPLFPLVSPKVTKGSVAKVDHKSQGIGYISEFYKVFSNSRLTTFDSRVRTLILDTIEDLPHIYTRVFTGGSYIETEVTTTAYYSSNTRIVFKFDKQKIHTGRFSSNGGTSKYVWMDVPPEIPIAVGVNEMTIPATGGIWYDLPQFGGTSNSATLSNFEFDGLVLADPPFFVQILEEKVLANSNFYESLFEVRYSI